MGEPITYEGRIIGEVSQTPEGHAYTFVDSWKLKSLISAAGTKVVFIGPAIFCVRDLREDLAGRSVHFSGDFQRKYSEPHDPEVSQLRAHYNC